MRKQRDVNTKTKGHFPQDTEYVLIQTPHGVTTGYRAHCQCGWFSRECLLAIEADAWHNNHVMGVRGELARDEANLSELQRLKLEVGHG